MLSDLVDGVASGAVSVVDLMHPLSERTPMISLPPPLVDSPGWKLHEISRYDERGPIFWWNWFEGSEHMGTHFDAPVHWITGRDGLDTSQILGADLIAPVVVIDRAKEVERDPEYLLDVEDVEAFEADYGPLPTGWLLMRTGWGRRFDDADEFVLRDEHGTRWPGMTTECARYLAEETALRGYGSEQIGIDAGAAHDFDPPYPAHHYLLGAGKFGLASLANLEQLPPVGSVLIPAPLRIVNGTGSPCRVYALVPK